KNVLPDHPPKSDGDIATVRADHLRSKKGKTQQPRRPPKTEARNLMNLRSFRRWNTRFRTKEMHFMTQISQPLSRSVKIPLRPSCEIESLMCEGDLHGRFSFSP